MIDWCRQTELFRVRASCHDLPRLGREKKVLCVMYFGEMGFMVVLCCVFPIFLCDEFWAGGVVKARILHFECMSCIVLCCVVLDRAGAVVA